MISEESVNKRLKDDHVISNILEGISNTGNGVTWQNYLKYGTLNNQIERQQYDVNRREIANAQRKERRKQQRALAAKA